MKPRQMYQLIALSALIGLMGASIVQAAPPAQAKTEAATPASDAARNARKVLALKLMKLDGTDRSTLDGIKSIMPLMLRGMFTDPSLAGLTQPEKDKFGQILGEEFEKGQPELLDRIAGYYADSLSESELNELNVHYQSPVMQKMTTVKLGLGKELQASLQSYGVNIALITQQRFFEWKKAQK